MKKQFLVILLCACMALIILPALALAAGGTQDGLQVSLTTDKSSYGAGETITVNAAVTNTNSFGVPGARLELLLPDGLSFKSGGGTATADLAAGQTASFSFKAVLSDALDDIPKTGDGSSAALWILLGLASAGALACLAVLRKKKPSAFLSVLLCLSLLSSLMVPAQASAATVTKSLTVTQPVTADGETYTLTAKLTYDYTTYDVTVNGGTGDGQYASGATVAITADAPASGMAFAGWTVVSGGVTLASSSSATTTFTMPAGPVEITAAYERITYAVTVNGGTGDGRYASGATVTITADAPASGMVFAGWTVVSGGVTLASPSSAATTFAMPAGPVEVTATYELSPPLGFSSNGNIATTTTLFGAPNQAAIVGENGSVAVTYAGSLDLSGDSAALALARTIPADTVLTGLSASVTQQAGMTLIGTDVTVYAQVYRAPAGSNVFTSVASATLGTLSGSVSAGTVLSTNATLSAPVSAGDRVILVYHCAVTAGLDTMATVAGPATATLS